MSWAWAAGLFEGEGSITLRHYKHSTMRRLTLSMTDFDVVKKFAEEVGCGQLHERKPQREFWSPSLSWTCTDWKEVRRILKKFLPYLGERKTKEAEELLAHGPVKKKLVTHCHKGHPMRGNNIYRPPSGGRHCRRCRNERNQKHRKGE